MALRTARSMISARFLPDTLCAISAAYFELCIISSSNSATLLTVNLRYPFGIKCRVFLFEP